jgi:chemotaxis protein CheX
MPPAAVPIPASLSDQTIEQAITKGVTEVFGTMTGEPVQSLGRAPNPPVHTRPQSIVGPHVVATVGFIGDLNGLINIHFDDELAIQLSAKMLGMTPEEAVAAEVISDASGELTNMIVGVFKNTLSETGTQCRLTLPTIIRGRDFYVDHTLKSCRRFIYNFRCRERGIVTDIIVQPD